MHTRWKNHGRVAAAALAWVLTQPSAVAAGVQSSDQQRCLNALNKAGSKVAATQGKDNAACIRDATRSSLINVDADQCLTADRKRKVSKATSKTVATQASRCTGTPPDFGFTSATTINQAATDEEVALVGDVFGSPVQSAILTSEPGASCQANVARGYEKLAAIRFRQFVSCKKDRLKVGAAIDAETLAACIGEDPDGDTASAEETLQQTIASRCGPIASLATVFPGRCAQQSASVAEFSACVSAAVGCRACQAIARMDGLGPPCDQFDDGVVNGTCFQCGNGIVEPGEQCDEGDLNSDSVADACRTSCQLARCGDLVTDTGEDCDRGASSATCDVDCTAVACGDGLANPAAGEECDQGGQSPFCDGDCTAVVCGDGTVNPQVGEGCDDGNATGGDGCSVVCACEPGASGPFCQESRCPHANAVLLHAQVKDGLCLTNSDCTVGTCNGSLSKCVTDTELDTGWTGLGHDADVNDEVLTQSALLCPGPFMPGSAEPCGECYIAGIDPTPGNCRCANDNRTICDQPLEPDQDDCAGALCQCYLGPPLSLSSGNTPACVLNRYATDVFGTGNVDTGATEFAVNLRTVVFLGELVTVPCPYCAGDAVAGDGVRSGTCQLGEDDGAPCDTDALNVTFPAPGGDGHSLDCFPVSGKNVSGAGLQISLVTTTGTQSLPAQITCGFAGNPELCPCSVCSGDQGMTCSSNADCIGTGECRQVALGKPRANQCSDGICNDLGGGEGECASGPEARFCDGVLRSNGRGFVQCVTQADCDATDCGSVSCGNCSLSERGECFLDPISATGAADPDVPIYASAFCIPPTGNNGINTVAGLPGPARVLNSVAVERFCASDPSVTYVPGIGGCPGSDTTTTTMPPVSCGATFPLCNGDCPPGQSCQLGIPPISCVCAP